MRNRIIDTTLLLLAGAFFALFFVGSILVDRLSGIQTTIGVLEEGAAQVKSAGALAFQPAPKGTEFYNLDAVWVGRGGSASIRMADGTQLNLAEKTVVVLKIPFNRFNFTSRKKKQAHYNVLEGEIDMVSMTLPSRLVEKRIEAPVTVETATPSPSPSASPSPIPTVLLAAPSPIPQQSILPTAVFPENGSTFIMTTNQTKGVVFSWTNPLTGTLLIQAKTGASKPVRLAVQGQKSIKVSLVPIPGEYEWKLVDTMSKALTGPHTFKIRRVDKKDLSSIISREANMDSFYIY